VILGRDSIEKCAANIERGIIDTENDFRIDSPLQFHYVFNNFPEYSISNLMSDNIVFSSNLNVDLANFLQGKKYSKVAVLIDENTREKCYPLIKNSLPVHTVIEVKAGEEFKNLRTCEMIWERLTHEEFDRHSVILVLGGGVLGDMGGFCAATYKRGIDFVLISTTLLSQVDSSIGGKLGIDFQHFKNHIGVFQLPAMTLLHEGFLNTLPRNEMRSGFAEIIKHILISDAGLWDEIRNKTLDGQDWKKLIRHSVEFKARVVGEDPKEKGLRKILNTGHTIGHALETHLLNSNRKVMHGEAIAAGLITEGFIALKRKMISTEQFDQIKQYILTVFGKIELTSNDLEPIARLTLQDKKNKGTKILCVLLDGVGKARWDCEISLEEVKEALTFYLSA
jgi:3-dehydroquinate synthase